MSELRHATPLPQNPIAQLWRGAGYVFEALGFIRRARLWGLAAAGIAVNVVLLAVLVGGSLAVTLPILAQAQAWLLNLTTTGGILHGFFVLLGTILTVALVVLVVAANALVLALFGQTLAGPFLDLLSERVEELERGFAPYPFAVGRLLSGIVISLKDLVASLLLLLLVNLPITLIGLTGVGSLPAAIASFCFSAWLLAHQFVGLSLIRHQASYSVRWRVVRKSKLLSLGFGAATMALVVVPGLNVLLLPLAAVGGTLLYCDLVTAGRIEAPTRAVR